MKVGKNQVLIVIIVVLMVVTLFLLGRYRMLVKEKAKPSLLCSKTVGCHDNATPPKGACAPGKACT